ncbi:hypothetical protein VCR9J2_20012 [Vibrio crassostreae]|nr:hypothetical protein VCR9J2_20012 [Vibrio crassostreae]
MYLAVRKSRRADARKRDARYEERERQMRVNEMRDARYEKQKKSRAG